MVRTCEPGGGLPGGPGGAEGTWSGMASHRQPGEDPADQAEQVDQIVGGCLSPGGPGLVVLVGRGPEVVFCRSYGLADVATGRPAAPRSRFLIGSVTKQFTCMGIMLLAGRGRLGYDDPVGRYLPEMPRAWRDRVTLRHLMHHTGGVPEYLGARFWQDAGEGRYPDLASILQLIAGPEELEFEPGARWRYTNSGYVLLGEVVSRVAGQPFARFLREQVFLPLGMEATLVGEDDQRAPDMATGYEWRSREDFQPAPWSFAVVGGADGNVISDAGDLHRWSQAMWSDRLLPRELMAQALVPAKPHDPAFSRYGFGLMVGERRGVREVSHSGSTLGYVANLSRYPDQGLTVVLLSNAAGIPLARLRGQIVNLLLRGTMAPLEPVPTGREKLAACAGTYRGRPRDHQVTARVYLDPADQERLVAELDLGREGSPPEVYTLRPVAGEGSVYLADEATDTYYHFRMRGGLRIVAGGMVTNLEPAE